MVLLSSPAVVVTAFIYASYYRYLIVLHQLKEIGKDSDGESSNYYHHHQFSTIPQNSGGLGTSKEYR